MHALSPKRKIKLCDRITVLNKLEDKCKSEGVDFQAGFEDVDACENNNDDNNNNKACLSI